MPDIPQKIVEMSTELQALPDGWICREDSNHRIFFVSPTTKETTYCHPTRGPIPKPWILRMCSAPNGKDRIPLYFNQQTARSSTHDPRYDPQVIAAHNAKWKEDDSSNITASLRKMESSVPLDNLKRQPTGRNDIRHKYDILKVLDPGDGTLGGMNGGVYVVKLRGQERLSVEKRFKGDDLKRGTAQKEIKMLLDLKHASISFYTASFILSDLTSASVYVEFCDRGSLDSLITAYCQRREESRSGLKPEVPEKFLWHALAGLCDGLAYMQSGRKFLGDVDNYDPLPGWTPVLHRDMKPDNVLLKSRDTVGSTRYFYCVLSDFGLACEDLPRGHPEEDWSQRSGTKAGTSLFFAPELCWNPYPRNQHEETYYPDNQKHSYKSDLWALGASIYTLAKSLPSMVKGDLYPGALCVMDWSGIPEDVGLSTWMEGTEGRIYPMDIVEVQMQTRNLGDNRNRYSPQLQEAILRATEWDPEARPSPVQMIKKIKELMESSGYVSHGDPDKNEQLPSWATKVHDFHSRKPLDPSTLGTK